MRQIAAGIAAPKVGVDEAEWGYDHGTWSVLQAMFPAADIPVVQLSMDYHRPPAEHSRWASNCARCAIAGVLIVGSGNIVHNLRAMRREAGPMQAYDWAFEFDGGARGLIERARWREPADFQKLGQVAQPRIRRTTVPAAVACGGCGGPGGEGALLQRPVPGGVDSMRSVAGLRRGRGRGAGSPAGSTPTYGRVGVGWAAAGTPAVRGAPVRWRETRPTKAGAAP